MSEIVPETAVPPGAALVAHARTDVHGRRDRLRLAEYDRLCKLGLTGIEAWRIISADAHLGFRFAKRTDADGRVSRRMAAFLRRVAPERIAAGRAALLETIPDAVAAVGGIIRGDFGEGRVTVRGRGDNAVEVVEIDAAAAGVRSQNARWLLERTGVVAAKPTDGVKVGVQVNLGQILGGTNDGP